MNHPSPGYLPNLSALKRFSVVAMLLGFAGNLFGFAPDTPVTPGASPEVQSLLAFFTDIYGKKSSPASRMAGARPTV